MRVTLASSTAISGLLAPKPRGISSIRIVKIEVDAGQVTTWHIAGFYPGEPVFVPSPKAQAEDDGVLLSVVLDIGKDSSFLLVLDAATLEELARAEAPHAIPFHFHGNYFRGA